MKKSILFCLAIVGLVSCTEVNSAGEKTITKGGDTISSVEISTSRIDALMSLAEIDEPEAAVLKFKASGIEPFWFVEIYENKLRLLVNNGRDSLVLESKFEGMDNPKGFLFEVKGDKNPNNNVTLTIENKPCMINKNGDKKSRAVSVTYKKILYKGCGSFLN